jgi:hypothetical protein
MKYCIDTSALIDLGERHYPERLPVFEPIWKHVYQEISNGNIISVDLVRDELNEKADDWRDNFLLQADGMFHISSDIEKEFASLIRDIEKRKEIFNSNKARDRFMSGADPWVIALASNKQCTVISAETKKLADYGIGAICKELGVRHVNLVQFFEVNKVGVK